MMFFQWLGWPTENGTLHSVLSFVGNRLVTQMWAPLAACREPAWKLWQLCMVLYFLYNAQYLLIHAPFTRIVVFWHISNVLPRFRRVKFVVIPPRFVLQQYLWNIAIQPALGCYNSWANLRCSSCSPPSGIIQDEVIPALEFPSTASFISALQEIG